LVGAGKLEQRGDALYWLGEPPPNRQGRRVTEQVVEPPERPAARQVPPFIPSETPTILPVAPSETPAAIPPGPTNLAKVPSDIDRCLTPGGHQRLLDEAKLSNERFRSARQQGDPLALQRATAENDRLSRLLEETRVLPPPTDRAVIVIGSLVCFREADGPEETWQLVPPLEADAEQSRMSVLTPMGQALLGKTAGDVVEVEAPSGSYLVEVTAIELP
jgi:transcription elongation GreA/GreB family factor